MHGRSLCINSCSPYPLQAAALCHTVAVPGVVAAAVVDKNELLAGLVRRVDDVPVVLVGVPGATNEPGVVGAGAGRSVVAGVGGGGGAGGRCRSAEAAANG